MTTEDRPDVDRVTYNITLRDPDSTGAGPVTFRPMLILGGGSPLIIIEPNREAMTEDPTVIAFDIDATGFTLEEVRMFAHMLALSITEQLGDHESWAAEADVAAGR